MIERLSRLAAAVLAVCLTAAGARRFGRPLDTEGPGGDAARWTRGLR